METVLTPALTEVDRAGATLRWMRRVVKDDERYQDEVLAREFTAAIDALMRYRLHIAVRRERVPE